MNKEPKTITEIKNTGQCVSCGLCSAVCPQKCINMSKEDGTYLPNINNEECIKCGLCNRICPGNQFDYNREFGKSSEPENFWFGNYLRIFSMQTKNQEILNNATSGGFVTQIVKILLDRKDYDCAFLVNTHNYEQQVHSQRIENTNDILKCAKSRYIPVAQNEAVSYALKNHKKKIIFVGTSCFVHGIMNAIEEFSLNRDNYLILGLFCDRTMNYKIYDYFNQHPKCNGKLRELQFRTKESGGWPGNMRLVLENQCFIDLNASERMRVKDYFQLERCLYCLDKLNQFADISIGDDYSAASDDKSGRSAVIVRTNIGVKIIESVSDYFECSDMTENTLIQTQNLYKRKKNLQFIKLKRLKPNIPQNVLKDLDMQKNIAEEYYKRLQKIKMGKEGNYKQIVSSLPIKKRIFDFINNYLLK